MSEDQEPEDDVMSKRKLKQHERSLVESLIDCGEDHEGEILLSTLPVETYESVSGWERAVPNVRYQWPKKRRGEAVQDDIGIGYYGNHPGYNGHHRNRKCGNVEERQWPGMVPDQTQTSLFWRMGVEPRSYHYLPDNGLYRASKAIRTKYELSRPARKLPEKLTHEQRQLQREIQRELRQEFETFNKYEKLKKEGASVNLTPKAGSRAPFDSNNHRPKESLRCNDNGGHSKDSARSEGRSGDEEFKMEVSVKVRERSSSPVELPSLNVPLVSKSHNEEYLEKFRSRISALDEEIKRDQHIFRKSYDDITNCDENSRLTELHWKKIIANACHVANQNANPQKLSPRLDIGQKLKNLERNRRAAELQHSRTDNGTFAGGSTDTGATGEDLNDSPQAPNLYNMPPKKDTLTEETFKVRKVPTVNVTVETRIPCDYSNADIENGDNQGHTQGHHCDNPSLSASKLGNGYRTPPGEMMRITKFGHGSTSAPLVLESTNADDFGQTQDLTGSTGKVSNGFLIPKATEMASTRESLQSLIEASKMYGVGHPLDRGKTKNGGGRYFGEAFQSLPVGKGRPRRGSKKDIDSLPVGFLPEIAGKRLGQTTARRKVVRS